jgi:serine protease Do
MKNRISVALMFAAALALVGVWGGTSIAQSGLQLGGSASNFGRGALRGQFMPDPFTIQFASGGPLDASTLGLGAGCRGFVTRQPDYILDYTSPASFLRMYFVGGGDTTLIVNDAASRWHCNDDSHGGLNPTIDISRPAGGQYDIWVGSYRANENVRGTLHVTELRTRHP